MRMCLLLSLVGGALVQASVAADRSPPVADFFLDRVVDDAVAAKNGAVPKDLGLQALSLVGRDDLIVDEVYDDIARATCEPLLRNGAPVDPILEIEGRARMSGRIIIVNEAHDDPQTRAFIADLLRPLHETGFNIYAAETFMRPVGRRSPAWPRVADGTYSNEPVFGDLLRRARALAFEFLPYEPDLEPMKPSDDVATRIAARESAQSRNIMDRIIKPMPDARVLIHVGHHHAVEAPIKKTSGGETQWMAYRLKVASGIDPLTVDQTQFRSPSDRPVLCALASKRDKARALATDLTVALPKPAIRNSRPVWRRARGEIDAAIPASLRAAAAWTIVEARFAVEPNDAVPADRILVGPGETIPLLLKPGKYRIEGWTRGGGWSKAVDVTVD